MHGTNGIYTYIHLVNLYGKCIGKYTSPMDAMGKVIFLRAFGSHGIHHHEKPTFEGQYTWIFQRVLTLPETNSKFAPENRPFQKESSLPTIHFQVRTVSFREGYGWKMTLLLGQKAYFQGRTGC